jgi:hypothetical protein
MQHRDQLFWSITVDEVTVMTDPSEGVVWDADELRWRPLVVLRMPSWSAAGLARVLAEWSVVCAATGSSEGEDELADVLASAAAFADGLVLRSEG